jgi:hypothetical protein
MRRKCKSETERSMPREMLVGQWAFPTCEELPHHGTIAVMSHRAEEKKLVAQNVRPDSKKRVSIGAALAGLDEDTSFMIYTDADGRIILEPHVSVPLAEAWLFRNKIARESVARGLKQIKSAKTMGSFARSAEDDEP